MEEALYKGNSHDNGGIKVLVDGSKPIEVEGHEYLLCNKAMQSTKIFEFKNKTNKQILDEFHTYSTCEFKQNEAHSGDFIICKKVVLDTNKRNITGTIKEIVNIMQSEKGCRQSNDDVFKTGGEIDEKEVENQGSLNLMKWYINWYKNISDKMNITLSLPNLLAPFIEKNVVIMDLFEKINQDIDAKTYLQEIIRKADEYKVTIYLEPMPRYKYFLKNIEKRKKISKEYLIAYYEKFGFKLTPNAQFMKRKFNGNEINIFDETKYDDNGKVCYWKTYTFNDSSISIDYCLDNFFKIDDIGTKEKSRRGGDASKLIDYVKEIAVKNNFQKIDVYLPIDENTPHKEYSLEDYKKAVSFYKKNGFKFYKNSTVKMFTELKTKENENTNGKTEIDTSSNKLLIEKAILYISEGIRTAEKEPREYKKNELIDLEAKLCYNFAVANKLWIIDTDVLGLPLSGGGNENELYYEEKTGIISKVNNLLNHGASVLNFLKYIQYHNLLFEANSYNLIGFTGFDNEANNIKNAIPYVMPIISQIYVTESVKASINEIKKYMQIIGFEKVDEFTYKNSEYIVSDLRPRNVLKDSEGNIHVIDNIIKINEMKTGGDIKPIRQLGTGANVYFESDKYRVNDFRGKYLLNSDGISERFDDVNEAVFVAKKLQENAPQGLNHAYHNIYTIIKNYKKDYIESQNHKLEKMETKLQSKKEIDYSKLEPLTRQDIEFVETFKSADNNTRSIKFIWDGDFYEWQYSSTGSGGGIHIYKYNSLQALKKPLTTSGTHETIYNTWNRYQTTPEGSYIEYSIMKMNKDDIFGYGNNNLTTTSVSIKVEDYKNEFEINKAIEKLIDYKGANRNDYNAEEINFISYYSGYGGLGKYGTVGRELAKGLKYEFYTPDEIVKKMWGLAYKYGYGTLGDNSIFETSAGIGSFLKYAPKDVKVVCNEINKYSVKILEILYPDATIYHKYFEQNFITKNNTSMKSKIDDLDKYSLIIGNPPYGELTVKYIGMGEGAYTKAGNFCEYFITRSLDLLVQDGLLIYIVGAEQLNGGTLFLDSKMSKVKEIIFDKAHLIDAYRLPVKVFERTGVSSEILIFRKK